MLALFFFSPRKRALSLIDLIDETIISTGELATAKPGTYHKFEALEDTICYEIYWAELDHNDIEREDTGGVRE